MTEILWTLLGITLVLMVPFAAKFYQLRFRFLRRVDPVVLSYVLGITVGHFIIIPPAVAEPMAGLGVVLCIPLMLISFDLRAGIKILPMAFGCMFAFGVFVCLSAVLMQPLLSGLAHRSTIAAMITATFVGSAPNLASVGVAFNMPREPFLMTQTTDLIVSGCFFLFLMALGLPHLLKKLPLRQGEYAARFDARSDKNFALNSYLPPIVISVVSVLGALTAGELMGAPHKNLTIIVVISLLSLGMALRSNPEDWPDTVPLGEFVFLLFCAAAGSQLKLSMASALPWNYLAFSAAVLITSLMLHFGFCKLFGIDRNLFLISFSAGIFSPAMVSPIANRTGDRGLAAVGVAIAIFGLLLGTPAGLLVHAMVP